MAWTAEHLEVCENTMAEARQRALDGAPDGTVVVAERMEHGKGQHGHAWHAPEGGWYASVVLRDLQDPRLLTLALGNAVADVLEVAGAEPELKWVNDVLVDGKKVAGILVEGESTGDRFDFLVAGIGVNLNGTTVDWPDDLPTIATTLEEVLGVESCIEDTEPFLLDSLEAWVQKVRDGHRDDILEAFRRRDALRGKAVRVGGVEGEADGIDDEGRLRVAGQAVETGPVEWLD